MRRKLHYEYRAIDDDPRLPDHDSHEIDDCEFRLLVDAVEDYAIFLIDPDGRIATWNRGAARLIGYLAEEVVGRHFSLLYTDDDARRGHPAETLRLARTSGRFEEEAWRVSKDGRRFWAHIVLTTIHGEDGRFIGYAKVTRDLTHGRTVQQERERLLARQKFLADVGKVLTDSIQYETTLQSVAQLAVPVLADFSIVDIVDVSGTLKRVAAAHVDPARADVARKIMGFPPDPRLEGHPVNRAIRTRKSQIMQIGEEELRQVARGPEHARLIREVAAKSVLVVPLIARGNTLGAMQFISLAGESAREYGSDDIELAEELARRAAVAIDNARLYEEAALHAREERALREAVGAVAATVSTEDVIRQIADSSVTATSADGAFVTWVHGDRSEVEVVAKAGDIPPPLASRVAYAESYTRRVVEHQEPVRIHRLADFEGPLSDSPLASRYPDWSAIVLPLHPRLPIGALFLLRKPERPAFSPDEINRAQTFAKLAAITFRRLQLLEESERAREELVRISESRARLMRGFSHDVKNPLGAADGHAQLLQEGVLGALSEQQQESLHRIRNSIKVSLRLINDLLELARAEAGQIEIQRARFDVAEIAREVCEDFRAQAIAAGLALEVHAGTALLADNDATRVRQILSNLLANAVKYTTAGSITVHVQTQERGGQAGTGKWIVVRVTDTGAGIPSEKHEKIFQEFTRLDPKAEQGAGVGLAISRRLARLMGGEITVRSEPGRGSTFTLWLPVS